MAMERRASRASATADGGAEAKVYEEDNADACSDDDASTPKM